MNDQSPYIALIGNPNSGKTAIFNLLTGMNQKVSNYPGITVEKKRGISHISSYQSMEIWDLPGAYSLIPESMDEQIVSMQVLRWMQGMDRPRAIISVVDSCSLSRNLYLTSQLLELNVPIQVPLCVCRRFLSCLLFLKLFLYLFLYMSFEDHQLIPLNLQYFQVHLSPGL